MTATERSLLGLKRWAKARRFHINFRGTSRPHHLDKISIAGGTRSISCPDNIGHWHDFINIVLDDEYGLSCIPEPPQRIVDLGANIGIFSLWARHCFPAAAIQCYEPNPDLWPLLKENLKDLKVEAHQVAVASLAGRASFDFQGDNRCSRIHAERKGDIELISFDSVVNHDPRPIDLLKIDIEGGEWDLLSEKNQNLFRSVRRIVIEYHELDGCTLRDLINAAQLLGFSVEKIIPNTGFGVAWLQRCTP
jgi:FkbM family methyltransferase